VIAANPELQERELKKLASLSAALARALRRRGVGELAAGLTAEIAIAVFRVSFERWVDARNRRPFARLIRDSLDEVKSLTRVTPAAGVGVSFQRAREEATV